MGFIASSTTVTANAYLTELGRAYIFDDPRKPRYDTSNGITVDRLKIERFSLGDSDVNYNSAFLLESGDIPDVSGANENTAITGAKGRELKNIISPGDAVIPDTQTQTLSYRETYPQIIFDLLKASSLLATVTTQQLSTYVDGTLVTDGGYLVNPTNYGPNTVNTNGELIIVMQQPTQTVMGYRLRIFFPTTGTNYNKVTFQFESSPPLQTGLKITDVNTKIVDAVSFKDIVAVSGLSVVGNKTALSGLGGNLTAGNLDVSAGTLTDAQKQQLQTSGNAALNSQQFNASNVSGISGVNLGGG